MLTAQETTQAPELEEAAEQVPQIETQFQASIQESDEEILTEPDLDFFVVGERPVIENGRSVTISTPKHNLKSRMGMDTFQYAQRPFTKLLNALPQDAIPSRVYGYGSTSCGQVFPIAETKITINFDAKAGQKWKAAFDGQILLQYGLDLRLDRKLKESKGWCVMPLSENGCYVGNTFVPQDTCVGIVSGQFIRSGEWTCLLQFL